jgi:Transposase DDE domain
MQLHHRLVSILGRIRQDVATLLDKDAINAACREENYTWKNRLLNPTNTIHLFILQILNRNTALNDLPRKSHASFTGSAFCKARRRLPLRVFQRLLRRLAETLLPHPGGDQTDDEGRWLGLRTFIMDGSSCSMPDTPELQRHFGQPGNQRPGCGFPVAHLLVLFHAGTGLLREILVSPLRTHDMSQVVQLHPALEPNDVGLGDRGFCSYAHLALLSLKGVFGVFRIHQRKKVEFQLEEPSDSGAAATRSGRLPRWLYRLGARDHVVEWIKPQQAPEWMTASQYATLPERLVVRELRYPVGQRGFRVREVTLVTTLLDAELYPLEALAELYRQRWQAELHLRDLKITMNMDVLKCKTVEGVLKEIHVFALVYNLVRVVLQAASRRQHMSIARLSHVDAFRWLGSAHEGEALPKIVVNPERPDRVEPRAVKRRPKEYDRMTRPRAELRRQLLEGKAVA